MKKLFSLIAVLALVCFTTMVFAAGAPKAEAAKPAAEPAKVEATKAEPAKVEAAKAEMVIGKITKIDTAKNEIVVKGKTIVVKAEEIAKLKKGEKVKVTLAAGTMNAEKIEMMKVKKAVKKAEKKAEEKPMEKKAE